LGFFSAALPADNPMTAAELNTRVNDCFGVRKPATQRSPEQIQKSKTIVDVLKIPENAIAGHLNWGTFTLRDVVTKSGGASPFGNDTVQYRGSANDAALNAAVLRFKADPKASARFGLGQSGHQAHACGHRLTLRGLAACTSC
jgi:hypothetical protein